MRIKKYLEVLAGGMGAKLKVYEDDHFIRDENVPLSVLKDEEAARIANMMDDDDYDDEDEEDDDLDEEDYDEHGLDKTGVFDSQEERKKSKIEFDEAYTEDDLEADMQNLSYLIRQLFKNTNIEVDVDYDGLDIKLYIFLNRREKMKNLLKTFDVVFKLKKDILPQYHAEVELYESKAKNPVLCFGFDYVAEGGVVKKEESIYGDKDHGKKKDSDDDLPF